MEGIGSGAYHAGQGFEAIKFAECDFRQGRLDCSAKALVIDGAREATRKAGGELLEGHDLNALTSPPRGCEPKLSHRQPPVRDNRPPHRIHHYPRLLSPP
jgi:hypothetical protein